LFVRAGMVSAKVFLADEREETLSETASLGQSNVFSKACRPEKHRARSGQKGLSTHRAGKLQKT